MGALARKISGTRLMHCGLRILAWGLAMSVALFAGSLSAIAEEPDPTEQPATMAVLTAPDQSLDMPAPASQFAPAEGEKLWNEARGRAGMALPEQGAGFFSVADRL